MDVSATHASTDLPPGARSILEAATAAFARAGFDSVSIADIAAEAGVCKANVFHHFKSKEGLYLTVMREACHDHARFTEQLLARDDLSSTEKLRRLIAFDFADLFGNAQRGQLVTREILNSGCRSGREFVQPVFLRNYNAVVALLEQGRARGEFRADLDAPIFTWLIGGPIMLLFQNREILPQLPGLGAIRGTAADVERVFAAVLGGLKPAAPPVHRKRSAARPTAKSRKRVSS